MYYLIARRMDAEPGAKYLVCPFEKSHLSEMGSLSFKSRGTGVYLCIASDVSEVYGEYANHDEVSLEELKSVLCGWGLQL